VISVADCVVALSGICGPPRWAAY